MTIDVTQEDIEQGRPQSTLCCPVALAMRRITGKRWTVGTTSMSCLDVDTNKKRFLPVGVGRRISLFDRGGVMEPFSFEVDDVN
jgi:hypothetical protein